MSYCGDLDKQLTKAREAINISTRNSLGWYRGAILWNATVTEIIGSDNGEVFKNTLAPSNATLEYDGLIPFVLIPDFDMGQVLKKNN